MSVDLSGFASIRTSLFISVDIPDYGIEYFSNHHKPINIDGIDYTNLGSLLAVTGSTTELRASKNEVSISISGIPASNVAAINASNIKGSTVIIQRGIFDTVTGELAAIPDNVSQKFKGLVNNVAYTEDWDVVNSEASFTLTLVCTSAVSVLMNKVGGRRTNPLDEKKYYPNDLSMDRVPNIKNSNFNFGAPVEAVRIGTK